MQCSGKGRNSMPREKEKERTTHWRAFSFLLFPHVFSLFPFLPLPFPQPLSSSSLLHIALGWFRNGTLRVAPALSCLYTWLPVCYILTLQYHSTTRHACLPSMLFLTAFLTFIYAFTTQHNCSLVMLYALCCYSEVVCAHAH